MSTAGGVLVNTQSIHLWLWMRVLCSRRKNGNLYRQSAQGANGLDSYQLVLLELFKSYADSSISTFYCVPASAFWGNVTNRSSHFMDTIAASWCSVPMSCWDKVTCSTSSGSWCYTKKDLKTKLRLLATLKLQCLSFFYANNRSRYIWYKRGDKPGQHYHSNLQLESPGQLAFGLCQYLFLR